jgi:hypothetical protein
MLQLIGKAVPLLLAVSPTNGVFFLYMTRPAKATAIADIVK